MKWLVVERPRTSLASPDGLFLGASLGMDLRCVEQSSDKWDHMGNSGIDLGFAGT